MHGDGTVTTGLGKSWGKIVDCISWASLLMGKSATRMGHFIITVVLDILMLPASAGDLTQQQPWTEICWSLYWAYQGQHPDRDSSGRKYVPSDAGYDDMLTPLAGGYYLILWVVSGDLDFMEKNEARKSWGSP